MILYSRIYGEGFPLLIFHGLLGDSSNWQTLAKKISSHFEIHAIDIRNHGKSFHDIQMNYSVLVDDLKRYIKEYNLPSFHLLGHSLGGKIVMNYALQNPSKIRKCIVVDIAPKEYPLHHHFIFNALKNIDLKLVDTRLKVYKELSETILEEGLKQFLLKNLHRKNSNSHLEWKFNLNYIIKNYESLMKGINEEEVNKGEILFIKGEKSDYIQTKDIPLIEKIFPNYKLATIPKAGHWVHIENPENFYKSVMDFLMDSS